jgi:hypothetical protein
VGQQCILGLHKTVSAASCCHSRSWVEILVRQCMTLFDNLFGFDWCCVPLLRCVYRPEQQHPASRRFSTVPAHVLVLASA